MPSSYLKGISTITGKSESSFDEKVALVRFAYNYLKGNIIPRKKEGAWFDREQGDEGIYAEPNYNMLRGEVPGPVKGIGGGKFFDLLSDTGQKAMSKLTKSGLDIRRAVDVQTANPNNRFILQELKDGSFLVDDQVAGAVHFQKHFDVVR